ncbi:MAG: TonB family protein [Cyclobacteriaceae bacterium]
MEAKKNPQYDLHQKSPLFFAIGIVVALLIVTLAFEWRAQYDPIDLGEPEDPWAEAYVVPNTVFSTPEPPQPKAEVIKKTSTQPPVFVDKELEKVIEIVKTDEPLDDFDNLILVDDFPEPVEPEIFEGIVESMPSFPGGMSAFYAFVSDNLKYPRQAKKDHTTGRVFVQFIIDTDGSLTEVKAIKGIGSGCDAEAVRVIEKSPKWNPGKQRGRTVKVRMVLPIQFALK